MRHLAGALLAFGLAFAGAAHAQSPSDQMQKTRIQLEAASKALKNASGGRARLAALGKAVAAHEHALSSYREVLRQMRGREGRLKADLAEDSVRLETLIGAMQSLSQAPRSAIMMFPGGPVAAMRGAGMMSEIAPELAREAAQLRGRLTSLQQSRAAQEAARVAIRGTLATLQGLRNQTTEALRTRRGRKLPTRADLRAQAEVAAQTATNLGELSAALRASEAGDPQAIVSFTEARGLISPPVRGKVTAWFGEKDPQGRKGFGITMDAPAFAEVSAPWDGTIRYAGPLIDYGEVVILEPETGTLMVLAGLARTERVAGEIVLAGERLGDLGGPIPSSDEFLLEETTDRDEIGNRKLYIELRRGEEAVDPAAWFDLTEREAGR